MKALSCGIVYLQMIKSRFKKKADPYHIAVCVEREGLFVFH